MNIQNYFEELSQEIDSLKNRVRNLISDRHWLTDGEWKESVVRQCLRRNLPLTAVVSRGFVVTRRAASHQIDVLIHDASKPVLFRDGDLALVTPDAVLGIIEVKSKVTRQSFQVSAKKMAKDIKLIHEHPNIDAFAAIFAFDGHESEGKQYLDEVTAAAATWNERLDFAAIGQSAFLKYWHLNPRDEKKMYQSWHSYTLPRTAAGYFVHNVIDAISPRSVFRNNEVWFPTQGKELYQNGSRQGIWV